MSRTVELAGAAGQHVAHRARRRVRRWAITIAVLLALFGGAALGTHWAWTELAAAAEQRIDDVIPDLPNVSVQPALDRGKAELDKLIQQGGQLVGGEPR